MAYTNSDYQKAAAKFAKSRNFDYARFERMFLGMRAFYIYKRSSGAVSYVGFPDYALVDDNLNVRIATSDETMLIMNA
jgi:hypothetical protein